MKMRNTTSSSVELATILVVVLMFSMLTFTEGHRHQHNHSTNKRIEIVHQQQGTSASRHTSADLNRPCHSSSSSSSLIQLEKDLRNPLLLRQLEKVKQHREQASSSDFSVRYIHLALTQNTNEMIIQFHTFGYDENKIGRPMAIIGKSEQELQSNPQWYGMGAVTTSYGDSSVTGFDHAILLNNLSFDTTYYYRVGFGHVVNGKPVFTVQSDSTFYFTTRSRDPSEVTIVIFGDMGVFFCESNIERISKIVKDNTGNGNFFIYHVGDISYADSYPGFMYQYVWDKFFEHWEGVQPYVPYMTTVGNHEYGPRLGPDK